MKSQKKSKNVFESSVRASRKLAGKAGKMLENLGDRVTLRLESQRMNAIEEKLVAKLGGEVYTKLANDENAALRRDDPSIRNTFASITRMRARIVEKENQYKAVGAGAKS